MAEEDSDMLNRVLDEVAGFEVKLEPDPTLPNLGAPYLQRVLADCRNYINRIVYYVQTIGKVERDLKMEVRRAEMDIELKLGQKLADDPVVRAQPSIEDRKALANAQLRTEHEALGLTRLRLLEVGETMKLLRMKYRDMNQVSQDIKLQRQIVKDDKDAWTSGDGGYVPPGTNRDKTVPGGLAPAVRPKIDPADLLDDAKRPADLPPPVDAVHARQISDFFSGKPAPADNPPQKEPEAAPPPPPPPVATISYEDLLRD